MEMLNLMRSIASVEGGAYKLLEGAAKTLPPPSKRVEGADEARTEPWSPADEFQVFDYSGSPTESLAAAWPYVFTLSGVLSLLFNPETDARTLRGALDAVKALCWDEAKPAGAQEAAVDTIAGVAISMGVLVPLVSLQQAMGDSADPGLTEAISSLSVYLINRGKDRQGHWKEKVAEYQEALAGWKERNETPEAEEPVEEEEDPKAKKKKAKAKAPVAAAEPMPTEVLGDPNKGPTYEQWQPLLNSVVDDIRNGQKNSTPLLAAQIGGITSIVEALLHAGANSNIADSEGVSPLMRAVGQGNEEAMVQVVGSGGDVDCIDKDGVNVLKFAFTAPMREQLDDLMKLLGPPLVIEHSDEAEAAATKLQCVVRGNQAKKKVAAIKKGEEYVQQATAVEDLVEEGNPRLVPFLLSKEADPNVSDNDGNFPLHWALAGTSVWSKVQGRDVMWTSAPQLQIEGKSTVKLLLEYGE